MPHSDQQPERAAILYSGSMNPTDVLKHFSDASADYVALCTFDFEVLEINEAMKVKTGHGLSHNGNVLYHDLIGVDGFPSIQSYPENTENQHLTSLSFSSSKLGRILVEGFATQHGEKGIPALLLIAHSMEYSSTQPESVNALPEISPEQLVNALADVVFLCDNQGEILFCSEPVAGFFGLENKSRIIGSNFQSFIAYDSLDQGFIAFNSVAGKEKNRSSVRLNIYSAGRKTVPAEVQFSLIEANRSASQFILIVFRQTADADNSSEAILRKEARVTRIVSLAQEPLPEKKMGKLLSHFGEMLGADACAITSLQNGQQIVKATWQSPFNSQIPPELGNKQFFNLMATTEPEISLIRKPLLYDFLQSEKFNCDEADVKALVGVPLLSQGQVTGMLSAVFTHNLILDESDRQMLQMIAGALARSNQTQAEITQLKSDFSLRELLDCFIDSVYIFSKNGILLDINQGAVDMYGYPREKLIGQSPSFLLDKGKNDLELLNQRMERAFNGETQRFELWGLRKNGEVFPKEVVMSKGRFYDQDVLIAIGRDLTESKRAEEKLIQSNKELQETNLSKDKFFSILAHDLKNPFQGLLGFIDLLYEDLEELTTEQIKEYLFNVRSASYHTYSLLENLLDWSRIQSGKMPFNPSAFDICDEVESVISILDVNAERKQIRLINEVPKNTIVEADRNMIHSILQNLVTNSIKFSNVKGKVVIRSRVPAIANKSGVELEAKGSQWLEVSVADNGIGIPEELLPKLFSLNGQYSQSGTANEPGTGLGLVLCREMVEKNGGRIWAESIAGQGATFIFTIPLKN